MKYSQLTEFLRKSLPSGVKLSVLEGIKGDGEIADAKIVALLRDSPEIDWQGYLAANPDVARAGCDPCEHFVFNGIHEGRKLPLFADTPVVGEEASAAPKFSIIVYNRNNSLFLENTLESALKQSLGDLELIVVDDASTDESKDILTTLARQNPRIIPILNPLPLGMHRSRMAALRRARGTGLIFVDSGDYLNPETCALAWEQLESGCNLLRLGVYLVISEALEGMGYYWKTACNGYPAERFLSEDCRKILLDDTRNYCKLNFYVVHRDLVQAAFAAGDVGCSDAECDYLELASLARYAKSLRKLDKPLYRFRIFEDLNERRRNLGEATPISVAAQPLQNVADLDERLEREAKEFIESSNESNAHDWFVSLAEKYGIVELLNAVRNGFGQQWAQVGAKFKHYRMQGQKKRIKSIGIYYSRLLYGGTESIILRLTEILLQEGFKVTLFLHTKNPRDQEVNPGARIIYIGQPDNESYSSFLLSFYQAVQASGVDIMFFQDPWHQDALWEAMAVRYLGIPVLLFHHSAFYMPLLYPKSRYDLMAAVGTFSCMDKLLCLSPQCEFYFRSQGIDAIYLPNPIEQAQVPELPLQERIKNIVILGRIDSPLKQVLDALYIMADVVKEFPETVLWLVGNYKNTKSRKRFEKLASSLNIAKNIVITGWTDDPGKYLKQSAIFLSTSYCEGFPLGISEAQSYGLPCVIYDLPIAIAEGNDSIIKVRQGDLKGAARVIVSLLRDEERIEKLQAIARRKVENFAPDLYKARLLELFETFSRSSEVRYPTSRNYQEVMKVLGYYASRIPSWANKI